MQEGAARRSQHEMRNRIAADLFEPQLVRQVEPRQGRHVEQSIDEVVLLPDRDAQLLTGAEHVHPGERAEVAQPGNVLVREQEPPRHHEQRAGQRQDFVFAAQLPVDAPLAFCLVGDETQ